jgi:hypothetical protein
MPIIYANSICIVKAKSVIIFSVLVKRPKKPRPKRHIICRRCAFPVASDDSPGGPHPSYRCNNCGTHWPPTESETAELVAQLNREAHISADLRRKTAKSDIKKQKAVGLPTLGVRKTLTVRVDRQPGEAVHPRGDPLLGQNRRAKESRTGSHVAQCRHIRRDVWRKPKSEVRAISAFRIDSELRLLVGWIMMGDEHRESQQFVNRIFAIPLSKSGLTRVTPNGNSHHYIQLSGQQKD